MCVTRCYCREHFLYSNWGQNTSSWQQLTLVLSRDKSQSPCSCITRSSRNLCQSLWPILLPASFILLQPHWLPAAKSSKNTPCSEPVAISSFFLESTCPELSIWLPSSLASRLCSATFSKSLC